MWNTKIITGLLFLMMSLGASAQCDSKKGKSLFNKCAACHSLEAGVHLVGPSLSGIVGRDAASIADYIYSPAMANSGIRWDSSSLSVFLENPMKMIPGTLMPFAGIKSKADREALICFMDASVH